MPEARLQLDITELSYASDPAHYFATLRQRPGAVLLDSGRPAAPGGRFDILTSDPLYTLSVDAAGVHCDNGAAALPSAPFAAQRELLAHALEHDLPQIPEALTGTLDKLPFIGGLLGYWSYTLARDHRPQGDPAESRPGPDLPDARLGLYDWALIQDHQSQRTWLVASPERRRQVERWLAMPPPQSEDIVLTQPFVSDVDRAGYGERFRHVIDYLHAGDCYQVNLAQRFTARFRGDTWHAYRRLRQATPTPYGGYLRWDDKAIASLSPERFVRVADGQVETRPIKGTRPRGETPQADAAMAQALQESPKDRAENVMIVDLLRNDLGRVCRFGSVHVPRLCALESYANVHHLVSVVRGELTPEASALDLLAAAFPGGSITGAPKRRAMQIIDELEPSQRSVYCGSLGYVDRRGHLDTSIAIRTLVADGDTLHLWGGGGVVADSDEEEEYRETLAKIGRLMAALGSASDGGSGDSTGTAEGAAFNNQNI